INAGLDQVAFVYKITKSGLSDNNVRARDGDGTHHRLQFANGRCVYKWRLHTLSACGRARQKIDEIGEGHICPIAALRRGPTSHSTYSPPRTPLSADDWPNPP